MNALIRHQPIGPLGIHPSVFDFLEDVMRVSPVLPETGARILKIDVNESEAAYEVKADAPGVAKENVHVSIDRNRVKITVNSNKEVNERDESGTWVHIERSSSTMTREFSLGSEISREDAKASLVDGVLTLTLPKKKTETGGKIEVN